MIAAFAQPPQPQDVVIAVLAVLAGALIASVAALLARRTRNWLYHLGTVGGLLIVTGVAGQRASVDGAALGPWDAGLVVPLIDMHLTPVTAAGILTCVLGTVAVLLFERVPDPARPARPLISRHLEDDDSV